MHLLKHFKELTVRPKNAQELKGLILQLAIQGKLTAIWRKKNHNIESAYVLFENIQKDKERLIKNKKSKQTKKLSKVLDEEKPFQLPESWFWCRLGDITDLPYGKGLSKKDLTVEGYYVFGANGIIGKYSSYLYEDEQLLISCRGAYSGKTNISPKKCFVTSNSLVCEFFNKELTYYKYFFYTITALPKEKIVSGSAQPQVTATNALPLPIALPPLKEQKEIVKVIEILFKEVDQLEQLTLERISLKEDFVASALNQLATNNTKKEWAFLQEHFHGFFNETSNIKKLRETVLQLAVQGKLTSTWRASHPELVSGSNSAKELLKRIQSEKAQLIKDKKTKKERALPSITKDEIPYELPAGWVWCRFQDLILNIEAGKSPKCYPENSNDNEWGVIKMSAISWGVFNANENKALPPDVEVFEDKEIKPGDFILTRANTSELIAKSVIVQANVRSKLLLNDKTLRIRCFDSISDEYLNLYNNGSQAREHYKKVSSGTSDSMQNISRENIKLLIIPLPPLEEQKAIVQKVNALMGLCDALEQEVQQSQEQSEKLMQSVLRDVFEGKKELETNSI